MRKRTFSSRKLSTLMCRATLVATVWALALLPSRARAQEHAVLVARVIDLRTGNPLEGAELHLVESGRRARSDGQGIVHLRDIPPGSYNLFVRRFGYRPFVGSLTLHAGDSAEVAVVLRPLQLLDTVRVLGHAHSPQLEAFEMWRKIGVGHFLTDSILGREQNRSLVTVLVTRIPGLSRIWLDSLQDYRIISTRGIDAFPGAGQPPCFVQVYLDDMLEPDLDFRTIDPSDLAGVEYYGTADIPAQYQRLDSGCGVLLLWSKFLAR